METGDNVSFWKTGGKHGRKFSPHQTIFKPPPNPLKYF